MKSCVSPVSHMCTYGKYVIVTEYPLFYVTYKFTRYITWELAKICHMSDDRQLNSWQTHQGAWPEGKCTAHWQPCCSVSESVWPLGGIFIWGLHVPGPWGREEETRTTRACKQVLLTLPLPAQRRKFLQHCLFQQHCQISDASLKLVFVYWFCTSRIFKRTEYDWQSVAIPSCAPFYAGLKEIE